MQQGWGCPIYVGHSQKWACERSIMQQQGPRAQQQPSEPSMHGRTPHPVHAGMHGKGSPRCRAKAELAAFAAMGFHPGCMAKGVQQQTTNLIPKGTEVQGGHGWRHKAELESVHRAGSSQQSLQLRGSGDQRPARLRHAHRARHSRASRSSRQLGMRLHALLIWLHRPCMRGPSPWLGPEIAHLRGLRRA